VGTNVFLSKRTDIREMAKAREISQVREVEKKVGYAIVEISGRQFWVEQSRWYDVNRIPAEEGKSILLNRVLVSSAYTEVSEKRDIKIGAPYLSRTKIIAKVVKHLRGPKTIVYKMRPKKKTRKKQGHRQNLTRIRITTIL